ncbi:MAG: DUF1045 domain-containing protein, partial [Flavobacteriaceae bacterium]
MRVAIYFAPAPETALWRAASAWLGRDAAHEGRQPAVLEAALGRAAADEILAAPRRYGFHATLKAPFHLRDPFSLEDVVEAAKNTAARLAAFPVSLKVGTLSGFL